MDILEMVCLLFFGSCVAQHFIMIEVFWCFGRFVTAELENIVSFEIAK